MYMCPMLTTGLTAEETEEGKRAAEKLAAEAGGMDEDDEQDYKQVR